jgi:FtsX-like permease family
VIRLGLRLAVAGGKEAVARLAIIAIAVAIGVGLLLATLAGINAVNAQNARYAWLNTGIGVEQSRAVETNASAPDPLWWLVRGDYFNRQTIGRVDVAATGPHPPVPPGIPHLPGPGQFYASPKLSALLASTPAAQLKDRFPGHQIGTIGPGALPSPNSLIIIIGQTPEQLSHVPGAKQVSSIGTVAPGDCGDCVIGIRAAGLDLVLSVVAAALLFPLLIFIGAATRLATARREQRFAAMRLIGATPRQVSVASAMESTAAAVTGTALGFALFFLFRHLLAAIPFTGAPFYPGDLSLGVVEVLLVAFGVPAGAAAAALISLRRVRISPLGVTRRVTPPPPRPYRLIPLLVGLGEMAYFVGRRPSTTNGQVAAFLPGILLIMAGLVIAGPWLTMAASRVMARRASRPATLIAARRLADNPQGGFRAISGLVLALFVTSVAIGVITTIVANRGPDSDGALSRTTLSIQFWPDITHPQSRTSVPNTVSAGLPSVSGVQSVTVTRTNPAGLVGDNGTIQSLPGLVSCADLATAQTLGRCMSGAAVAAVWPDFDSPGTSRVSETAWPAADFSTEELTQLPVLSIVVRTDGSTAAIERARTLLEAAYPESPRPPATTGDIESDMTQTLLQWQQLANVIILTSLPIAGCSLAVSVAGGLSDRKRPFSLLRLSGAPLGVLRRVVALESAVPLLVVAAVAIGIGLLAAQLFLRAQMDYTLRPPGVDYYLIVIGGLAASLGIIASTFPLLERITGPETARNE